ncbi:MAG TPA: VWA domain-containing protein [Polyangia bacterium]|jgi:hypothetical protein
MRRLDAERYRLALLVFVLALASGGASCTKTWVLGGDLGAGGAGGEIAIGGGGSSGSSGFFGQGGKGGSGSGGHGCACTTTGRLRYDIPTSDMIFVVGRNQSMSTKFGDNGTRMTAVQSVVHAATTANQDAVNFGFQDFPSLNGCSNGTTCCPSTDIPVYPSPLNAGAIDGAFRMCGPGPSVNGCVAQNDSRSVAQALSSAGDLFGAPRDIPNDRYVVLITDGPPGCVTDDPQQACSSALKVLSSWAHSSIKTYVIGIGDAAQDQQCLQSIALMGQASTNLFDVADPSSLTKAINQIVDSAAAAACTVELLTSPSDPMLVSVFLQGRELCYDPTGRSGWSYPSYPSPMRIEINGADCAAVQAAPQPLDLVVSTGCLSCNTSLSCP